VSGPLSLVVSQRRATSTHDLKLALDRISVTEAAAVAAPPLLCSPSGAGRSKRRGAGGRLASILRRELPQQDDLEDGDFDAEGAVVAQVVPIPGVFSGGRGIFAGLDCFSWIGLPFQTSRPMGMPLC
jgi:hypothetical protein